MGLVAHIRQTISICVQQKKKNYTGLEPLTGE